MEQIKAFYNAYDEDSRLVRDRVGQIEYLTTRRYIDRCLTGKDMRILEIGAGTGRYSVTLAQEGYCVTAVEPVKHNIDVMKAKLRGDERITVIEGNALDLSAFADESFDLTLLLGPMYHLFTREDQKRALSEAVRVTKKGGKILAAYCMNESTVIQYVFGCNKRRETMNVQLDHWHCVSTPEDLFEMVRIEDIDSLNAAVPVVRETIVAADGPARYVRDYLESFDEETFGRFVDYHFSTCERRDLIGATNHALDILIRQ